MDEPIELFKAIFADGSYEVVDQMGLKKTVLNEKVYEVGRSKPITVMDNDSGKKTTKLMEITSVCLRMVLGVPTIVVSAKPKGTNLPSYPLWYRPDLQHSRWHADADALYGFTILETGDL